MHSCSLIADSFYLMDQVVTKKGDNPDHLIPGLMAAGEAACASVHGANRLGANSLLDIVVFGRACANRVAELYKPGQSQPELPKDAGEKTIAWLDKLRYSNGDVSTATIRNNMQRAMQNHAAVFRTAETLEEGRRSWTLHTCVLGLSYFYI
jgi:succinate dehydrogenase (ubiquinone) flavoprotein subunit